jgi:LPXTG-motif cell wall-anchored protein
MQSGTTTWLQAIGPTISFDADRGATVTLNPDVPMANALCDKAETELKKIVTTYGALSWIKDSEIDKTLQHNLDLVEQTRGKNPSVTMVTYAAGGTVAKTVTTERAGETHGTLWIVLAGIAGLVVGLLLGLFVVSRKKKSPTPSTIQ